MTFLGYHMYQKGVRMVSRLKTVTHTLMIGLMAIVQLLCFPVATFAETPSANDTPDSSQTTAVSPASPTGADAKTYSFNKDTGLWENDYYTWDPATSQTEPKTTPTYTYNPATGMWDTTEWKYDVPSGTYIAQPVSASDAPAGAATVNTPAQEIAVKDEAQQGATANAAISNTLNTTAQSGTATVTRNTTGGDAQSGDALAIANILNVLQSSWGMDASQIATFMANINGDVVGDLLLDPAAMSNQPLGVGSADTSDIEVTVANSGSIQNDIAIGSDNLL
jgi:hypothetical protein